MKGVRLAPALAILIAILGGVVACSNKDDEMRKRVEAMETSQLTQIVDNYPPNSKPAQFIREELMRRGPQKPRAYQETAAQTSRSLPETRTAQRSDSGLAHKLANINARGYVSPDHLTVSRFRSLLNQMSGKFTENEQQIADMSVKALELLENEGVQERLLTIMEGLNSLPVTAKGLPSSWHEYRQYVAMYVTSRTELSHDTTIKGLRALIVETLRLVNEQ